MADGELDDLLTCGICFEKFRGRNPKTLSCGHSFCSPCITDMLKTKSDSSGTWNDTINCPLCRKQTEIPEGNVEDLPACFTCNKLESVVRQMKDTYLKCSLCQQADVSYYCLKCLTRMCRRCKGNHDKLQPNHHQLNINSTSVNYLICDEHGTHVTYFCVTCAKSVCTTCRLKDHSGHKVHELTFENRKVSRDLMDTLDAKEKSANERLERVKNIQRYFNEGMERVKQQLKEHYQQLIAELEQQFTSLDWKLKQRQNEVNAELEKRKRLAEGHKRSIISLRNEASGKIQPIKEIPEARITNARELLTDIRNSIPSTDVDIREPKTSVFVKNTAKISLREIRELGIDREEYQYSFRNIDKLSCDTFSHEFYIRSLPWNICIEPYTEKGKKYLSIYTYCNKDSKSKLWSCKANVVLKLLPQKPGVKCITKGYEGKDNYSYEQKSWGYGKFIEWNALLKNGYVKNNTITVAAIVEADIPDGISK